MLSHMGLPILLLLLPSLALQAASIPLDEPKPTSILAGPAPTNANLSSPLHSASPDDWIHFTQPIPSTKLLLKGRLFPTRRLRPSSVHYTIEAGVAVTTDHIQRYGDIRLHEFDNPWHYGVYGCYFYIDSKLSRDRFMAPTMTYGMVRDVLLALEQVMEVQKQNFEASFVLTDEDQVTWGHGEILKSKPDKGPVAEAFSVNAVPATPVLNGELLLQQASNFSRLGSLTAGNDGPFGYAFRFHDDKPLNSISMLMNSVDALAQLALKNHRDRSSHFHFTIPAYPTVRIDVVTIPPATDFLNEVATYCIYYGMVEVVQQRKYEAVELTCSWFNVDVMEVFITNPNAPTTTAHNATEPSESLSATNTTTDAAATADAMLNALRPRFWYFDHGHILNIPVTFINIMYALARFSKQSATDIVPRCYTDPGPEWEGSMVFPADGPIRSRPPYLEYRYVIQTLRQIPAWMLQHGKFAELAMSFWVDGIHL
ncbi:MAG: hypothetical protein Q9181_007684, partial [Wetmoreana brouardii]